MEDYCAHRAQVVAMIADYYRMAKLTDATAREVIEYGLGCDAIPRAQQEEAVKDIDRSYWRMAFERTGFMQLLDAESRKKFDNDIQKNPPEFNIGNIRSTFLDLSQNAEKMFNDGIVNVFRRLSGGYMTNDVFKVGDKIISEYMTEPNWSGGRRISYGRGEDEINDIDRVFKILDGKKHQPRELSSALNGVFREKSDYEDDYYKARTFKNGNLHLWFKRTDLLERVNVIIAQYYGGNAISKGARR
jgi:hypothetical protein